MIYLKYRVGAVINQPSDDAKYIFIGMGKNNHGEWREVKPYGNVPDMAHDNQFAMFHGVLGRMYHPPEQVRLNNRELTIRPLNLEEKLLFQKVLRK